jgi:hypothetical protein
VCNEAVKEIGRIFDTRLETLEHIVEIGANHYPDAGVMLKCRLADDMLPFAAQIAFACNQARAFTQWSNDEAIEMLGPELDSLKAARQLIGETRARLAHLPSVDTRLDEVRRIPLGAGLYCELPVRQYVSEMLLPNLYFHIAIAYAILRAGDAPLGKPDFMSFLMPHVRSVEQGAADG